MDKQDFQDMARGAGIDADKLMFDIEVLVDRDTLMDFAALVAAAAKAEEREACAKVFERASGTQWFAENVAAEIRARQSL